ncbi:MAG: hypothetical protein ACK4RT_06025 [Erythrobacter sp.]
MMTRSLIALAALALGLWGCAGGGRPGSASAPVHSGVVRVPQVMAPDGLEGVIGQDARKLTQRFGAPRLDVTEGDARKLQFSGGACVLDIYLYPPRPGADPLAAHVEARLRQGGAAVDRGACIREIERR